MPVLQGAGPSTAPSRFGRSAGFCRGGTGLVDCRAQRERPPRQGTSPCPEAPRARPRPRRRRGGGRWGDTVGVGDPRPAPPPGATKPTRAKIHLYFNAYGPSPTDDVALRWDQETLNAIRATRPAPVGASWSSTRHPAGCRSARVRSPSARSSPCPGGFPRPRRAGSVQAASPCCPGRSSALTSSRTCPPSRRPSRRMEPSRSPPGSPLHGGRELRHHRPLRRGQHRGHGDPGGPGHPTATTTPAPAPPGPPVTHPKHPYPPLRPRLRPPGPSPSRPPGGR
jgi:hypothetical protein